MQDLRDAPGYAEMEDYYDSDYVPVDLIQRYTALQQEKRKRIELQFIAATQVQGLAATFDGLVMTTGSTASLRDTAPSLPPPRAQGHPAPTPPLRSTSSSQRRSTQLHGAALQSAPRRAPRTSVALDEIYAAREVSHGYIGLSPAPSEAAAASSRAPNTPSPLRHIAATTAATTTTRGTETEEVRRPTRTPSAKSHAKSKKKKTKPSVQKEEEELPRDLYDSAAEVRRQERFFSESRRLGKPFVPSGGSGLDVPTRFMLGDCVKILYRSIVPDWRDAAPMVVSTAEDLIAVYFSIEKLAKARVTALLEYMNASLLHNSAIREFHLTKVPEGWDVLTNDGYVLYTFRPPWVKKRVFLPDTINPSHAHIRDGEG